MCITNDMLIEIVNESVKKARKNILRKIQNDVDERTFYCDIIIELLPELERNNLSNYYVDAEYNRAIGFDGEHKGVGIYDKDNHIVNLIENNAFDIVVHLDGTGDIKYPENLIHIEVKKKNNPDEIGREKDRQRLCSTTKFPDKLSTQYLGIVYEANKFESLYNFYKVKRPERAKQIDEKNHFKKITKINQEIFGEYKVDHSKSKEWYSSIIAGYQLGAFIDIGEDNILIDYYYSGTHFGEQVKIDYE